VVFQCRIYYAQVLEESFEQRGVRAVAFKYTPMAKKYKPGQEGPKTVNEDLKLNLGFVGQTDADAVGTPSKGDDVGTPTNKGGAYGGFVDIEPAGIVWGNGNTASKLTKAEQIASDEVRWCRLTVSNLLLIAPLVSALEAIISEAAVNVRFQIRLAPLQRGEAGAGFGRARWSLRVGRGRVW
jgi:hypothetical protein